jgi:non-ribosomal peptide synthetase component F
MFVLQNTPAEVLELPNLEATRLDSEIITTRFDLEIHWWQTDETLSARVIYNTDLFHKETIERLASHYEMLLESVASDPAQRLFDLLIASPLESQQMVEQ